MSRDYDPIIPSRDTALNQLPKLTDDLVGILRKNNLPEKEIEYRAERLLKAAEHNLNYAKRLAHNTTTLPMKLGAWNF